MDLTPEQLKLGEIFYPYTWKKHAQALKNSTKFVHYTTAENALKIIESNEIWMRKSSAMNDFREIHHGLDCLSIAYTNSEAGNRFKTTIDQAFDGLSNEIAKLFDNYVPHLLNDTYLTCVSEHKETENKVGRLSMWRSYGASGVGLVLHSGPFLRPSDALMAFSSPVAYLDHDAFQRELDEVTNHISGNIEFVKSIGREKIKNYIFNMFKMAVICTKHPGFEEEQEWRVTFTPSISPSKRLAKEIKTISGIPQPIYKIPLKDIPEEGFYGAEIPKLLDRLIIGPTQYPQVMYEAFVDKLTRAGVENVSQKVFISDIPLRRS